MESAKDLPGLLERFTQDHAAAGLFITTAEGLDPWQALLGHFHPVAAAGGVVLDEDRRLLAIRRLGKWDLPKGKVDPGESIEEAAVREVQEECGLQRVYLVRPFAVTFHTYPHKGREVLKRTDWFLMRASANEAITPQGEEGITDIRWIAPEEADAIKAQTYPSLLPVIDAWLVMA